MIIHDRLMAAGILCLCFHAVIQPSTDALIWKVIIIVINIAFGLLPVCMHIHTCVDTHTFYTIKKINSLLALLLCFYIQKPFSVTLYSCYILVEMGLLNPPHISVFSLTPHPSN